MANSNKEYAFAVYLGRFQPFHDDHLEVCKQALDIADNLIILIGGEDKARQAKNPWTVMERVSMITRTINIDNLSICGIHDHPYSDSSWAEEVKSCVETAMKGREGKVVLIGYHKDDSSYYLNLFPEWSYVEAKNCHGIDATTIRDVYFNHPYANILATGIPQGTRDVMEAFRSTPEYTAMAEEHAYIKKYKQSWAGSPFPTILNTVDIAVIQNDAILTIQRGGMPGKGLIALPGGYIDHKETLMKSAMRELKEETCVDFSEADFTNICVATRIFDHPHRSQLGRCITSLYVIDASDEFICPEAGDDAAALGWLPFENVDAVRSSCSGDHWYMMKWAIEQYNARKKFKLKAVK